MDPAQQEALRAEAMRKIMETERMEEKRRRRAAKIAHMVCIRFPLSNLSSRDSDDEIDRHGTTT